MTNIWRRVSFTAQKIGKSNLLKKVGWLLLASMISISAFGQQSSWTPTEIFYMDPSEMDADFSVKLLRLLFGPVGSTLNGNTIPPSNPLISEMFNIYNTGVLVMTGLLISYSVVMSTITVSQEGSQAFQGKVSPFLMFRIVMGSSLLIPSFGGFSGVQLIVMSVVVNGVGFANTAWQQAVDIVNSPTSASNPPPAPIDQDTLRYNLMYELVSNGLIQGAAGLSSSDWQTSVSKNSDHCTGTTNQNNLKAVDMLSMALCMKFDQATYNLARDLSTDDIVSYEFGVRYQSNTATDAASMPCSSSPGSYACFGKQPSSGSAASGTTQAICGLIKFDSDDARNAAQSAINSAISTANSYSNQSIVNTYFDDTLNTLTNSGEDVFSGCDTYDPEDSGSMGQCQIQTSIYNIADNYASSLIDTYPPASSGSSGSSSSSGSDGPVDSTSGWATAGQYFSQITQSTAISATSSSGGGSNEASSDISNQKAHIGTVLNNSYYSSSDGGSNYISSPYCYKALCFCQYSDQETGQDYPYNNYWAQIMPTTVDNSRAVKNTVNYSYATAYRIWSENKNHQAQINAASGSSGTSSGGSAINQNTPQSQAACRASNKIFAAASDLTDLPGYLTTSNVLNPWNILNAFGVKVGTSIGGGDGGKFTLDHATKNMTISMMMALEGLSGMKILSQTVTDQSSYESLSEASSIVNSTCKSLSNSCSSNINDGSYFKSLLDKGCLFIPSCPNSVNQLDKAGLFGMSAIDSGLVCQGTSQTVYADPIRNLTNVGVTMMRASILYYVVTMQQVFKSIITITLTATGIITGLKITFAIANAASAGAAEGLWTGAAALVDSIFDMMYKLDKYALELFLPLGSAVAGLLFVQGVTLGVYLPFLAFFYYSFGVLGWTMAVVEAMIAAPLVALGMTHPEGHDLLGQAEQAIMLLLGVFLRPICMVIGLFFAISISQTAMSLINSGYLFVMLDFFNTLDSTQSATGSIGQKVVMICTLGLFIVYSYVVFQILDMSYGLIVQIPDRILRWIGGPQDQTAQMVQGAVSQIKGQTGQMAQAGASGAGQASSRGVDTGGPQSKIAVGGASDGDEGGDSAKTEPGGGEGGGAGGGGDAGGGGGAGGGTPAAGSK